MKKILLAFVFTLFSLMSFSSFSATLTLSDEDAGAVLNVTPGLASGQFVSGTSGDIATFEHDWGVVADGNDAWTEISADGHPDSSNVVTGIALFLATDLVNDLIADVTAESGNVFSFKFLLEDGVDYIIRVTGTGPGGYVISAQTPIPAAVWLFGSALMGLVGFTRRKSVASPIAA